MEPESGFLWVAVMAILLPILIRYFIYDIQYKGTFREPKLIKFHGMEINISDEVTFSLKQSGTTTMSGTLLNGLPKYNQYDILEQTNESLTILFIKYAKLHIIWSVDKNKNQSFSFDWVSRGCSELSDSFNMLNGHWYGAGHLFDHPWPMEKWNAKLGPFITGEPAPFTCCVWPQYYGGVQERYWLCSSGVSLHAEFDIPLFVSTNYQDDNKLILVAKYASPYQNNNETPLRLQYTMVQSTGIKEAHQASIDKFFDKPTGIPSEEMFSKPIWSTWAQYKKAIDTKSVLDFADNIRKHGFEDSQLEIDDDWTPHYGDFDFDFSKFPDPKALVDTLKQKGFHVTIWMHPFISPTGKTFWEYLSKGYWVRSIFDRLPAIVQWWNGYSALLDITDPNQREWYLDKLKYLQTKYGIDSFKFDAGDAIRLSTWSRCKTPLNNPNHYTKLFAEVCAESDTTLKAQELRVATGVQHMPMFIRLQDKDSNWGTFNGMKTVIPHILTQGLIGYPFVLPDMIGGNAYSWLPWSSAYPERELYIRWIQLNALMPSMQFSVVPWMYDKEVVKIAKDMCKLHKKYAQKIIDLANESVKTGAPICRPLWWISPEDEIALTISTEFLLGDDILVAPVLDKGAVARDIYLPAGEWVDQLSNNVLPGGRWYHNYPAPLENLPFFIKSS